MENGLENIDFTEVDFTGVTAGDLRQNPQVNKLNIDKKKELYENFNNFHNVPQDLRDNFNAIFESDHIGFNSAGADQKKAFNEAGVFREALQKQSKLFQQDELTPENKDLIIKDVVTSLKSVNQQYQQDLADRRDFTRMSLDLQQSIGEFNDIRLQESNSSKRDELARGLSGNVNKKIAEFEQRFGTSPIQESNLGTGDKIFDNPEFLIPTGEGLHPRLGRDGNFRDGTFKRFAFSKEIQSELAKTSKDGDLIIHDEKFDEFSIRPFAALRKTEDINTEIDNADIPALTKERLKKEAKDTNERLVPLFIEALSNDDLTVAFEGDKLVDVVKPIQRFVDESRIKGTLKADKQEVMVEGTRQTLLVDPKKILFDNPEDVLNIAKININLLKAEYGEEVGQMLIDGFTEEIANFVEKDKNRGFVNRILREAGSGLFFGAEDLSHMPVSIVNTLAPEDSSVNQFTDEVLDERAERQRNRSTVKQLLNRDGFALKAVNAITREAPSIFVTRGLGKSTKALTKSSKAATAVATGFGVSREVLSSIEDLRQSGATKEQQLRAGLLVGITSYITTNVFNKLGAGGVENFTDAAKTTLRQDVTKILKNALGEGSEELIQTMSAVAITNAERNWNDQQALFNSLDDALLTFTVGAVLGGAPAGKEAIINTVSNNRPNPATTARNQEPTNTSAKTNENIKQQANAILSKNIEDNKAGRTLEGTELRTELNTEDTTREQDVEETTSVETEAVETKQVENQENEERERIRNEVSVSNEVQEIVNEEVNEEVNDEGREQDGDVNETQDGSLRNEQPTTREEVIVNNQTDSEVRQDNQRTGRSPVASESVSSTIETETVTPEQSQNTEQTQPLSENVDEAVSQVIDEIDALEDSGDISTQEADTIRSGLERAKTVDQVQQLRDLPQRLNQDTPSPQAESQPVSDATPQEQSFKDRIVNNVTADGRNATQAPKISNENVTPSREVQIINEAVIESIGQDKVGEIRKELFDFKNASGNTFNNQFEKTFNKFKKSLNDNGIDESQVRDLAEARVLNSVHNKVKNGQSVQDAVRSTLISSKGLINDNVVKNAIKTFQKEAGRQKEAEDQIKADRKQQIADSQFQSKKPTGSNAESFIRGKSSDITLQKSPKSYNKITKTLKDVFGADVQFFKSRDPNVADGYYDPLSNTVFVNSNLSKERTIPVILGHEFAHSLEVNNPELWVQFAESITTDLNADRLQQYTRRYLAENYRKDQFVSEVIADIIGEVVSNPKALPKLRQLVNKDTLFDKIARVFGNLMIKSRDKLRGQAETALGSKDRVALDLLEGSVTPIDLLTETLETHIEQGSPSKPVLYTPEFVYNDAADVVRILRGKGSKHPRVERFASKKQMQNLILDSILVTPENLPNVSYRDINTQTKEILDKEIPDVLKKLFPNQKLNEAGKVRKTIGIVGSQAGGNAFVEKIARLMLDKYNASDMSHAEELATIAISKYMADRISKVGAIGSKDVEELWKAWTKSSIGGNSTNTVTRRHDELLSRAGQTLGLARGWRSSFGITKVDIDQAVRSHSVGGLQAGTGDKIAKEIEQDRDKTFKEVTEGVRSEVGRDAMNKLLGDVEKAHENLLLQVFKSKFGNTSDLSERGFASRRNDNLSESDAKLKNDLLKMLDKIQLSKRSNNIDEKLSLVNEVTESMQKLEVKGDPVTQAKVRKGSKKNTEKIKKSQAQRFFERKFTPKRKINKSEVYKAYNKSLSTLKPDATGSEISQTASTLKQNDLFVDIPQDVLEIVIQGELNNKKEVIAERNRRKLLQGRNVKPQKTKSPVEKFLERKFTPKREFKKSEVAAAFKNTVDNLSVDATGTEISKAAQTLKDNELFKDAPLDALETVIQGELNNKKQSQAERNNRRLSQISESISTNLDLGEYVALRILEDGQNIQELSDRELANIVEGYLKSERRFKKLGDNETAINDVVNVLKNKDSNPYGDTTETRLNLLRDTYKQEPRQRFINYFADWMDGLTVTTDGTEFSLASPTGGSFRASSGQDKIDVVLDWIQENKSQPEFASALKDYNNGDINDPALKSIAEDLIKRFDRVSDVVVDKQKKNLERSIGKGGLTGLSSNQLKQALKLSVIDDTLNPYAAIGIARGREFNGTHSSFVKIQKKFQELDKIQKVVEARDVDFKESRTQLFVAEKILQEIAQEIQVIDPSSNLDWFAVLSAGGVASIFSSPGTAFINPLLSGGTAIAGDAITNTVKSLFVDTVRGGNKLSLAERSNLLGSAMLMSLGFNNKQIKEVENGNFKRENFVGAMKNGLLGRTGANVFAQDAVNELGEKKFNKLSNPLADQIGLAMKLNKQMLDKRARGEKITFKEGKRALNENLKMLATHQQWVFSLMQATDNAVGGAMVRMNQMIEAIDFVNKGRLSKEDYLESFKIAMNDSNELYDDLQRNMIGDGRTQKQRDSIIKYTVQQNFENEWLNFATRNLEPDPETGLTVEEEIRMTTAISHRRARAATGTLGQEVAGRFGATVQFVNDLINKGINILRTDPNSDKGIDKIVKDAVRNSAQIIRSMFPTLKAAADGVDRFYTYAPVLGMSKIFFASRALKKAKVDPEAYESISLKLGANNEAIVRMWTEQGIGIASSLFFVSGIGGLKGLLGSSDEEEDTVFVDNLLDIYLGRPEFTEQEERNFWVNQRIKPYMIRFKTGVGVVDLDVSRGFGAQFLFPAIVAKRASNIMEDPSSFDVEMSRMMGDVFENGLPTISQLFKSITDAQKGDEFAIDKFKADLLSRFISPNSSLTRNIETSIWGYETGTEEQDLWQRVPLVSVISRIGGWKDARGQGKKTDFTGRVIKAESLMDHLRIFGMPFGFRSYETFNKNLSEKEVRYLTRLKSAGHIPSTNNSNNYIINHYGHLSREQIDLFAKKVNVPEGSSLIDVVQKYERLKFTNQANLQEKMFSETLTGTFKHKKTGKSIKVKGNIKQAETIIKRILSDNNISAENAQKLKETREKFDNLLGIQTSKFNSRFRKKTFEFKSRSKNTLGESLKFLNDATKEMDENEE